MRTHFFAVFFPAINHWFEEVAVETSDKFSIIYIFTTLFENNGLFISKF